MLGFRLPDPPPNVHRVYMSQIGSSFKSREFPHQLRGIMQEGEYADYLRRIEEALHFSKKIFVLPLIFVILFPVSFILVAVVIDDFTFVFIPIIVLVLAIASSFFIVFKLIKEEKKMLNKLETLLREINTRFHPRGVKWTFNVMHFGKNSSIRYLDIITFAPGAPDAPPLEGAVSYGPTATLAPGAQGSYPAAPQYAEPPPKAKYYEADTSYPAGGTATMPPPGTNPYGYPPTAPQQQQNPDGVNPYAAAAYPGAYPGDPSNPYAY